MIINSLIIFATVGTNVFTRPQQAVIQVDHAPLFGGWGGLAMLSPERERWAIVILEEVGPERKRASAEGGNFSEDGSWYVFNVSARVLDGWNVSPGRLQAFWEQDGTRQRRDTLASLVGSRVLVRLAPTEDGHYLWVGGNDEKPSAAPNYSIESGKHYLDRVLPTDATKLASGSPHAKRWYSLWQAGASLSPSTYPEFAGHMSVVTMPQTGRYPKGALTDGRVGEADVQWLQRFARKQNPEFQMMVADYLESRFIVGARKWMRELFLLALRDPKSFPDGVFRSANLHALRAEYKSDVLVWPPVETVLNGTLASKNPLLIADMLDFLTDNRYILPTDRGRLLPYLSHREEGVRQSATQLFDVWHGTPPKGADALAWHRARAKLGSAELKAAKASSGG